MFDLRALAVWAAVLLLLWVAMTVADWRRRYWARKAREAEERLARAKELDRRIRAFADGWPGLPGLCLACGRWHVRGACDGGKR